MSSGGQWNHNSNNHSKNDSRSSDSGTSSADDESSATAAPAAGATAGPTTATGLTGATDAASADPGQDLSTASNLSADAQSKTGYRRSYKACDSCRARKIRCDLGDLDAPSEPPCKRCKRERQDCTFTTGVRGNRHGRTGLRASVGPSRRSLVAGESDSANRPSSPVESGETSNTPAPAVQDAERGRARAGSSNNQLPMPEGFSASSILPPPPPPPPRTTAAVPTFTGLGSSATGYLQAAPHRSVYQSLNPTVPLTSASTGVSSVPQGYNSPFPMSSGGSYSGLAQVTTLRGGAQMPQHNGTGSASGPAYPYLNAVPRMPAPRGSFEFATPQPLQPPPPPLGPPSSFAVSSAQPVYTHAPMKPTVPSPAYSSSASPAPGPSPANSAPHSISAAGHAHHHQHPTTSPASSSASPAASADSSRQRGRGLKRSNTSSSSSLLPTGEASSHNASAMTPTGSSIDRAALAQVSLQNSRDALKLLATLAGGAKHNEEERERDRDRSRERANSVRERSRDRARDRSRDRLRDRSRERSRERHAFVPIPAVNPTSIGFPGSSSSTGSGPASSAHVSGRTSLNLGAVHRMQRPVASPQPSFQFQPPPRIPESEGEKSQQDGASATQADQVPAHPHKVISASAPSTPRGESGAARFGSGAESRPAMRNARNRSRGAMLEPAVEEDEMIDSSDDDLLWPRRIYSRQTTPQRSSRLFTLADFEPVRLKILKRNEVKMLVEYFFEHIYSFAPHCPERYVAWTPEIISELVECEPILLGTILSVASRYCHSGATNVWPEKKTTQSDATATSSKTGSATSGNPQPVSWKAHLEISSWTHAKVGRALFDPSLHTIGTVEALLMLSEWSTIDIDAADMMDAPSKVPDRDFGNEDEEDEDVLSDGSTDDEMDVIDDGTVASAADGQRTEPNAEADANPSVGHKRKRRVSGGEKNERKVRRRRNFLPKAHLFDAMAWQLISMAARMAEAMDIHNEASYYGLDSLSPESRDNAERRLKVWMRVVHADTQLSIRLGRRGMTDGALTPAWLEILRSHAFRVVETAPIRLRATVHIDGTQISPRRSVILAEAEQRARREDLSIPQEQEVRDRMIRWVETRAFAELMETVAHARDMIHLKSSTTEAILLDDKFEVTLRCIRTSLEAWARWVSTRVGNTMSALRLRLEYHEARLYAYGPALDALVQRIGRARARGAAQANDMLSASENLLIHPAYPFAVEAVGAAQTMIRMLTSEIESLRCAPARYFLLIVYATLFLLKASAASSVLLPLPRCLASVQAVINTLLVAGPDRTHLCRRYALLIRKYAKQFILLEVEDNASKMHTPVVTATDALGGSGATNSANGGLEEVPGLATLTVPPGSSAGDAARARDSATNAQSAPTFPASNMVPTSEAWPSAPSAGLAPGFSGLYAPFGTTGNSGANGAVNGNATGMAGGNILTAYDWMWDDIVNPNFAAANDVVDVDDFLQWLDTAGGAPTSTGGGLDGTLAMNFEQGTTVPQEQTQPLAAQQVSGPAGLARVQQQQQQSQQQQMQHASPRLASASANAQHSAMAAQTPSHYAAVITPKADDELNLLMEATGSVPLPVGLQSSDANLHMRSGGSGVGSSHAAVSNAGVDGFVPAPNSAMDVDGGMAGLGFQQGSSGSQQGEEGGDLRKLTSGWFASVMGSINRMS
ncbi:hypothetical protein CF326_g2489 [Tilletia indica]|nr:hypothetical protein CF326_g2489 [Tilletia indica]